MCRHSFLILNKYRLRLAYIHFFGDIVNAFEPDLDKNLPTSVGLKFGLCRVSQVPIYSIVFRNLSQ